MRTAPIGGNGDFKVVEEGTHFARWTQLIDIGTQQSEFGAKRTVLAGFEILDDEPLKEGERPQMVWQRLNWSMNEKAKLRSYVHAVIGKKLTDDDAASYDVVALVEKAAPCQVQVVHNEKNGKTYANIANITGVPKGMKPGPARGEVVVFDLDSPDDDLFTGFSENLKKQIEASPEWKALGPTKTKATPSKQQEDEELPF